ncbi:MAG: cytoplasmic protein [Planctomycetes bacterium]|nr:cytoplasmic protein [Planctomycetota bacterium]
MRHPTILDDGSDELSVDERITPVSGAFDTRRMAIGEPGLPLRFAWRGREYSVSSLLRRWKETGDCASGSSEQYVRKHWFRVRATTGEVMDIYFERQARSRSQAKQRWWLHAVNTSLRSSESE